ncbi:hypothetical protein [Amycolatopsis arida]|uniref:hypothetical protein n=1 Tax=Amycolatopsis arida TaxID=587909 RepID=UPI0010660865|nr:hypothetical protein [Amycolatopsis arida]TDX84924.1 hypothetical protein CLV69_1178 [Amycolatopsis arida]
MRGRDDRLEREQGPRTRRRGQAVLARLRTTADFTYQAKLSLDDRKLILFLVAVLADEDGRLSRTYEAVLAAHGRQAGHWCEGKTLAQLQKAGAKWLGRSAERRPPWPKVVDLIRAGVPAEHEESVLATAHALHQRARGEYRGEFPLPWWAEAPVVTVEDILAALPRPAPPERDEPRGEYADPGTGMIRGSLDPDLIHAVQDLADHRVLIEALVRAHLRSEDDLRRVTAERERYRHQTEHQRRLVVDNARLRAQLRLQRRHTRRITEDYIRLIRLLHPQWPVDMVRAMVREELRTKWAEESSVVPVRFEALRDEQSS